MDIKVEGLGKRYNFEWIFRDLNYFFKENQDYAITGSNGSGKSTLVKILSSSILPTTGKVLYSKDGNEIKPEDAFLHLVFAAPYLELIEEFTLKEIYSFHYKFKTPLLESDEFVDRLRLTKALNKQIKFYSSGMKQRLKLGLCFFSQCDIIILDEPTSNLDFQGVKWYKEEVDKLRGKRSLFVCSNQPHEYEFCKNILDVEKDIFS